MTPNTLLGDRTLTVPTHNGHTILPNQPLFEKLLRYAHRNPPQIAIRDLNAGLEKSYAQLLTDAIALRQKLRASLTPETQRDLDDDKEVFVALVAPGGYEYAVGFVGILAMGAAVVPISPALPVQEAKSLVSRAQCVAILSSTIASPLAQDIVQTLSSPTTTPSLPHLQISTHLQSQPIPSFEILISSNKTPNMNAAALVIYTSGTTGPPKGAVQRRSYITSAAEDVADHYRLTERDTVLHCLPVHHATGIGLTFLPFLVVGGCVEFRSGGVDAGWTWERFKEIGTKGRELSVFSGVPTIYTRLMRHFETHISPLPLQRKNAYITGARKLRTLLCGTSALPAPVQNFWKTILNGKPILTRYGGTEFHTVLKSAIDGGSAENSVGGVSPGVDLKLSGEGEGEGEILVKSPLMFSKYLNDPVATASAHDAQGYFKTGDIATIKDGNYFILGRASIDIIKSGGYKLSALDIEREILGLQYVSEVMVVGVDDEEFGQRVGAAVVLKDEWVEKGFVLSLKKLRSDLRESLAGYKRPTILRVLDGEIPKSGTGKVQKKIMGPVYFPVHYRNVEGVQVWEKRDKAKL